MDAVKVVTFDDGSNIITRISELRNDEGQSICFVITYPFELESYLNDSNETSIRFGPYNVFTQDTEIRIPFNAVRAITNPKKFIYDKYLEVIKPFDPIYSEKMSTMEPGDEQAPAAVKEGSIINEEAPEE